MELREGDRKFKEASETKAKPVSLDDILTQFNVYGRYHARMLLLLTLAFVTNSMYSFNYIFVVEKTEYRCKNSVSLCDVRPHNTTAVDVFNPQCYERVALDRDIPCAYDNNSKVVPCTEWVYERPESFVAEFQIACQEWKSAFVGTAHCIGYMIGLLMIGPISDRIGRKKVFIVTAVLSGVIGVTRSFLTNYWLYIFFEFLEAIIGDLCSPAFMLSIEIVATQDRGMFVMITNFGYVLGHMLLATTAWYFHYWRNVLQIIYAPAFLFILYVFWIDESPRWLLTKGRKQEAIDILKKAAKTNGMDLDKNLLDNLAYEDSSESNIGYVTLLKTTLKSKVIMKRFLVCTFWWITGTFLIYGTAVNSVLLSGNKYANVMMIYLMDIPAQFAMGYTLTYFSRKTPLMLTFFGAAVFFGIHPFIPSDMTWLSLVCYIGGKFMVSMFFNINYVFTSELFPTYTRNSMHALCSSIGRIGSIVAQQTPLLLVYWHGLPSIMFAGMAFLAAVLTLLVPDTADDDLPDTVLEAENIGVQSDEKSHTRL